MTDEPVMPDFVSTTRAFRHDASSALVSLEALGVVPSRVVLEPAGPGPTEGCIVWQLPVAGHPIGDEGVRLGVAGPASFEALPYSLRERPAEAFGIDRLLNVLDQPLIKLRYDVREGGSYLRLRRGDDRIAARWISDLFLIPIGGWPRETWFALARFLPSLHRVAGTEHGLREAMQTIFQLPIAELLLGPREAPVSGGARTTLGEDRCSLGVDTVAGSGMRTASALRVTYGPVVLDTYLRHVADVNRSDGTDWAALRQRVYSLVLPTHLCRSVGETWIVGDPDEPSRLDPANPSRLGVDSYLAPVRAGGAS